MVPKVDCNHALSQALLNLASEILNKSGATIATSDSLPTVAGDEVMVVQLFQNLVRNSIRYKSDAAPTIKISAVRAGERWLFQVRDNGIGIDKANSERVFDLFRPLDGAPRTGIGLALCRKVVERHGGRMWVESEAGHGAAFRFTIPTYLDSPLP